MHDFDQASFRRIDVEPADDEDDLGICPPRAWIIAAAASIYLAAALAGLAILARCQPAAAHEAVNMAVAS